jgi:UDP-3-O-[3-hydroxymyristoyl] glucosamine N-acyltransferase
MKLSELAAKTGARVEGSSLDMDIEGAAGINEAKPGHVSFGDLCGRDG